MAWHKHHMNGYVNRQTTSIPPLRIIDCFSKEKYVSELEALVKKMELTMEIKLSCVCEDDRCFDESTTPIELTQRPLVEYLNDLVITMYNDPIEQVPVCLCFQHCLAKIKLSQMSLYLSLIHDIIEVVPHFILFFRFKKSDMNSHYRAISLIQQIDIPYTKLEFMSFTKDDVILTARFEKKKNLVIE